MRRYLFNLALILSHAANTVLAGEPRDSLSTRCGRAGACRLCRWLCKVLDRFDRGHCQEAAK
jgi:hypothetical protein